MAMGIAATAGTATADTGTVAMATETMAMGTGHMPTVTPAMDIAPTGTGTVIPAMDTVLMAMATTAMALTQVILTVMHLLGMRNTERPLPILCSHMLTGTDEGRRVPTMSDCAILELILLLVPLPDQIQGI